MATSTKTLKIPRVFCNRRPALSAVPCNRRANVMHRTPARRAVKGDGVRVGSSAWRASEQTMKCQPGEHAKRNEAVYIRRTRSKMPPPNPEAHRNQTTQGWEKRERTYCQHCIHSIYAGHQELRSSEYELEIILLASVPGQSLSPHSQHSAQKSSKFRIHSLCPTPCTQPFRIMPRLLQAAT